MSAEKPRRLGRGLDALIPGGALAPATTTEPDAAADLQSIPLSSIRANPFQPRRVFAPEDLAELEASLRTSGLLQPISVRRAGDAFELIAGERRVRAARNLGWTTIQALVREFDNQTMLILALVENLQRADLNPVEEARGYRRLAEEFHLTQQQIADSVGKDRTTVTNLMRMLSLPAAVQQMVEDGKLSGGHARALLAIAASASAEHLATEAAANGWSVRELERRVREGSNSTVDKAKVAKGSEGSAPTTDPAVRDLEDQLRRFLQTDVQIQVSGPTKGHIRVAFYSADDLERLLDLILRGTRQHF